MAQVVGGYSPRQRPRLALLGAISITLAMISAASAEASLCQVVTSIGTQDQSKDIVLQPDGKILLAGYSNDGTSEDLALARYLPSGHLDTGFGAGGIVTTPINAGNDQVIGMALQTDGKIVVAGFTDVGGGDNDYAIARYNPDGSLDTATFNPAGTFGGAPNLAGIVTTAISPDLNGDDQARGVDIQADGKIVAGGWSDVGGFRDISIVRYNADGSPDDQSPSDATPADAFNPGGGFGGPPNTAGMVTTAIGTGADDAWDLVIQPSDGKIVVTGAAIYVATSDDLAVVRYNTNGSVDFITTTDFGGSAQEFGRGVAIRPSDNKIVVGGGYNPGVFDFAAARYDTVGGLDPGFGPGGFRTTDVGGSHDLGQDMTLQPNEKVLVAGWSLGANWDFGLLRYDADGTAPDAGFGTGGVVTTDFGPGDDFGEAVAVQPDGRIVVGGSSFSGSDLHFAWARYYSDGTPDVSCPAVDQIHYRWRNDDGTDATATFAANEDTKLYGLAKSTVKRLRFEVSTEGTLSSGPTDYELQVAESSSCPSAAPAAGVRTLAASESYTCARLGYGQVQCWGQNNEGQLGDGTTNPSSTAVPVVGIITASQVTAGRAHACAGFPDGTVSCWGSNSFGELGDGSIAGAVQITAGEYHNCARLASGAVECWGLNDHGQLGDGTDTDSTPPVAVIGVTDAIWSSAGHYHTCTARATGSVECWGDNRNGQLGDGTDTERWSPVPVSGLSGVVEVSSGGWHTCARSDAGTAECWGRNSEGQLGDTTFGESWTPVPVSGLSGAVQLASGGYHTCALLDTGGVSCWGRGTEGQLGDGAGANSATPVSVSGITNAVEVASGYYHTCAVLATGEIACWGANWFGELGDGTNDDSNVPVMWVASTGPTLPYTAVPTDASGHWQITDSTYFTDGDPTADHPGLTDEATTFVAGQLKDTGNTTASTTLASDAYSELEFAVQAISNATDGGDYCFRLYDAANDYVLGNYPVYAQVQLARPTAVELVAFTATGRDQAAVLEWQTGSELDNLGFHLYRGLAESGPWSRITPALIPGLGSSPVGSSYSWTDTGLQNGTRYYYRLEDIDTASVSTLHGPASAVPQTAASGGEPGAPAPGPEPSPGPGSPGPTETPLPTEGETPPGEPPAACSDDGRCLYGALGEPALRVLSRTAHEMTVELETPGFVAFPDPVGVSVDVVGFASPTDTGAVDLPFKRAVLDAVVGRNARLVSIEAFGELSFSGIRPAALGSPQVDSREDGTVRAVRQRVPLGPSPQGVPRARLAGSAFMGQGKKLALEIYPLRWDPAQDRLVLSRTLRVRIAFTGTAPRETGDGSLGRRIPRTRRTSAPVFAHFYTTARGLHAVPYEAVFPSPRRPLPLAALRLVQDGQTVPVHVEPEGSVFGPGSILYFLVDREASSTAYSGELSFALERAGGGMEMARGSGAPLTGPVSAAPLGLARFETNRIYQSGLLQAPDIWLWEYAQSGSAKNLSLDFEGVNTTSALPVRVRLFLQGGSDASRVGEHHMTASWNGVSLGETSFEGMVPHVFEGTVPASALLEGTNTLTFANVGDTGVVSRVFLDRVEVHYPQTSALRAGHLGGEWAEAGTAEVGTGESAPDLGAEKPTSHSEGFVPWTRPEESAGPGSSRGGLVTTLHTISALDVTDPTSPVWLSGLEPGPDSVRLQVENGRRYAVVAPDGLLVPRVSHPTDTGLRDTQNQADYVLVAPRAFMDAAQPLLLRRESQGLTTFAASLEDISQEFGGGSPSAEAIRDFLALAYHSWQQPSPRYVLLLGDASFDPRNFTGFDQGAPLPALWAMTSYLWTASDSAIAAVNGEDLLPDLALGRLPATNLAQAHALVQKVLDWEDAGHDLSGPATLVADNPDRAGNFEADIADIRQSFLAPRNPQSLLIRILGSSTRGEILDDLNGGLSLLSYVGHGGSAVWASENVLNSFDPPSLLAQSQQPLMLTMNCLNGYFVQPNLDSLAEAFLKAEGRGTIAAFSPSGLSLDGPAHVFHRALVNEIVNGDHHRLGDAVLAAQQAYAFSGHMPELIEIYGLFGDPAMRIR